MRAGTQTRIDVLHAQIAELVAMEKKYFDRTDPQPNAFLREIRDCRIDVSAWPPAMRARERGS